MHFISAYIAIHPDILTNNMYTRHWLCSPPNQLLN